MPVSRSHLVAQKKAAGTKGQIEARLKSGRRVDAVTRAKATEVERSPAHSRLVKAAEWLKESHRPQKVLVVPDSHLAIARMAMRKVGISGTVKNLSGTRRSSVSKAKHR